MTFTLLDASQPATSLGLGGGGLGYGGLPQSIAVTLDTYQNGLDPSGNFLGVADGVLAGGKGGLRYVATSTNVGPLKAGTHDVGVDVHGGRLQVTVDGDLKIDTQVTLPAYVRPGFTAGTGKATDRHLVRDVMITSPQLRPDTVPPAVTLTRPTPGTLTGTTTVAASAVDDASGTARVAFTLDGRQLGAAATTAPYQVAWDTTRVPNGKHTLAATAMDAAGNVATSKAVTVTVNNPLPVDGSVSTDGRGTLTAPPLTTTKSGDLLLALVSAHGPGTGGQSMTVSGGGLTWSLVKRAAGVRGTAELWQARASRVLSRVAVTARPAKGGYDGSLTVLALSGTKAATTATARSATTGAPSVALRTGYPGSWVVGVGSDPGSAAGRRPVAGQTLVHQWADRTAAATFWVQLSSPAVPAGTTTRLADTWPTTDGWNLVAVELPRA
jgi:hypothetical protein